MRALILGGTGLLGRALIQRAKKQQYQALAVARSGGDIDLDITDSGALRELLAQTSPDLIINAAANVNLADCESNPEEAFAINAEPAKVLAKWSQETERPFVQVSSDHFFDGDGSVKHDETMPVVLLNKYAASKRAGEVYALQAKSALILRTSIAGFHPDGRGFAAWALGSIAGRKPMTLFDDFYGSTIDVSTFCVAAFDLIEQGASGLLNLASSEVSSKQEFIMMLSRLVNVELDWVSLGSVTMLKPRRARSLGLDVSRAEQLLGRDLPGLHDVCVNLVNEWKKNHEME